MAAAEIARAVINTLLAPTVYVFCAVDGNDNVVGIVGGLPDYDGFVWEMHPLVVKKTHQGHSIGRDWCGHEREAGPRCADYNSWHRRHG